MTVIYQTCFNFFFFFQFILFFFLELANSLRLIHIVTISYEMIRNISYFKNSSILFMICSVSSTVEYFLIKPIALDDASALRL